MKRFIWIFLATILAIAISNFAFAESVGTFKVTLDKVEISRDGGRSWVTIHSGAREFDLKALSGGSPTAFSSVSIPAGTYNKWKVHCTAYDVAILDVAAYGGATVSDSGTCDVWDYGDMRVIITTGGTTSAIWTFDDATSYKIEGPANISLDPQITIQ